MCKKVINLANDFPATNIHLASSVVYVRYAPIRILPCDGGSAQTRFFVVFPKNSCQSSRLKNTAIRFVWFGVR